jgi:Cu/Ag efflux pump CusA
MSFSVGFGLLVATVLTLGIVPTLYVVCRRAQERLGFRNPALDK